MLTGPNLTLEQKSGEDNMTSQKLRAAMIGCGLGVSYGYAYDHAPEFELVAICDLKPEGNQRIL